MAGVLIERAGFLASLEGLLGEALDGSGRLVFLGGEAGVGKTTLAAALADAAGVPVRRGSCDNVTTAEALGPILDAFPELITAVDDEAGVSRLRLFRKVREALLKTHEIAAAYFREMLASPAINAVMASPPPMPRNPEDQPATTPIAASRAQCTGTSSGTPASSSVLRRADRDSTMTSKITR